MSVVTRWKNKLQIRRGLERAAKRRHTIAQRALQKARDNDIHPRQYLVNARDKASKTLKRRRRQIAVAKKIIARHRKPKFSNLWGGCRGVTNEIVSIVGSRASISSRKRSVTLGNPGSDHYVGNVLADAVDFRIAEAYWLKDDISKKLGGPSTVSDYQNFYIIRKGKRFRVQLIAGTHGTGPHLHAGVRRA